jgi:DNA-binding NtrC family response regulator
MAPMHVLVLERDPERRDALLGALRAGGHHAVAAPDGAAAAAAIGLPGFDALLLDLDLPDLDRARLREAMAPAAPTAPEPLEAAERRHIALMLRHTGGNKRQAAHLLGISRSTLLHKVRKYGLAAAGALVLTVLGPVLPSAAQPSAAQPSAAQPSAAPFSLEAR